MNDATRPDITNCQGGAIGTPFLLYTADGQHLFAQAFAPTDVSTLAATVISDTDRSFAEVAVDPFDCARTVPTPSPSERCSRL